MVVLTSQAVLNFIALVLIRGCTPLMMHFAVLNLHSYSLVVVFKCWITLALFLLSAVWFFRTDQEVKQVFIANLHDYSLYGRLILVGIIQSGFPYLLLVYSVQYLPPTLIGVAIVASPWWIAIIERLPFVKLSDSVHWMKKCGMILGAVGSIIVYVPILVQSLACFPVNAQSLLVNKSQSLQGNEDQSVKQLYYDSCLSGQKLLYSTLTLFVAPIVLGSATVFWKLFQKDTHYLVSSIGQNMFGGLLAFLIWMISGEVSNIKKVFWSSSELIPSILFLGTATGWLATLLLRNLYLDVGAAIVNRSLVPVPFISFIMDCLFVKSVIVSSAWVIILEVIGLSIITVGIFLTNLPASESNDYRSQPLSQPLLSDNWTTSEVLVAGSEQVNSHHYESSYDESEQEEELIVGSHNCLDPSLPPLMAVT